MFEKDLSVDDAVTNADDHAANGQTRHSIEIRLERIACPLCGSPETSVVHQAKDDLCGIPGQFALEKCLQCHHRFMNPRPVLECLSLCYPTDYGPHQSTPCLPVDSMTPSDSGEDSNRPASSQPANKTRPLFLRILPLRYIPGLKRFYDWLLDDHSQPIRLPSKHGNDEASSGFKFAQQAEKPRALEVGCATGQYLLHLQNAGWKATGIEPSVDAANVARHAGLDVHCGTMESRNLPDDTFELVAAWMVLEHVADPRKTLVAINRTLDSGGELLFSIPNGGSWEAKLFGRCWYALELPRHLHQFSPRSIRTLLGQCGFDKIVITHQRNVSNIVGSLGLVVASQWPASSLAGWLLRYPGNPNFLCKLVLSPFAHFLAWIHQGGRLTISARRSSVESKTTESQS